MNPAPPRPIVVRHARVACALALFASALGAAPAAALEDEEQEIAVQVVLPESVVFTALELEITRAGVDRTIILSDEGLVPGDNGWDGIWVGSDLGPFARYLSLRLAGREAGGATTVLFSGLEWTPDRRRADIGLQVLEHSDGSLEALRVAVPTPGRRLRSGQILRLAAGFGWGLLALGIAAVALLGSARQRDE